MRYKEITEARPPSKRSSTIAALAVSNRIGQALSKAIPQIQYTRSFESRHQADDVWLLASNTLIKNVPQTTPGTPGVTGVAIRFNGETKVAAVYEITSHQKNAGGKMVKIIMAEAPDYKFSVNVDLSGGFWQHMRDKYPDRFTN